MKKGVSIITPCFNAGDYIGKLVASVEAQGAKGPWEIVIADDCSTQQKNHDELKRLQDKTVHPHVKVVYAEKNGGTASARNLAMSHAQYDKFLALDADEELSTDPKVLKHGAYMDRVADVLDHNSDVVIVYARTQMFEAARHRYNLSQRYDEKRYLNMNPLGSYDAFRRTEAEAVGGYNPEVVYAEDWDFGVALVNARIKAGRPAKVHRFEEPHIMYRVRANGSSKTALNKLPFETHVRLIMNRSPEIFDKHYPGLKGEELLSAVMADKRGGYIDGLKEVTRDLFQNPVSAVRCGASSYVFNMGMHALSKVWRASTGQFLAAVAGPSQNNPKPGADLS